MADTGGFHKAGAELQLSQSAISQHIHRLKRAIGQPIVDELAWEAPGLEVKFRFDRTTPLNERVDRRDVDLAVFIAEAGDRKGTLVGALPLAWCAAPELRSAPRRRRGR